MDDSNKESVKKIIEDCWADLDADLGKNLYGFSEAEDLRVREPFFRAFHNTFAEKYWGSRRIAGIGGKLIEQTSRTKSSKL